MTHVGLRFFTRLRDWSERKMLDYYAHSRRCPHCLRWTHAVGGAETRDLDAFRQIMKCNQCQQESEWELHGPLAISVSRLPMKLGDLLIDVAQLLDGWHADGTAWSEWDESVRRRVTDMMLKLEKTA